MDFWSTPNQSSVNSSKGKFSRIVKTFIYLYNFVFFFWIVRNNVNEVTFVPYANAHSDYDGYTKKISDVFSAWGNHKFISIKLKPNVVG